MVFTLDNYTRLLDPLYFEVLLHSLNMALIATLACPVLGYPFAPVSGEAATQGASAAAVSADCSVLDQLIDSYLRAENFPQHQRLSQRVLLWLGVIDTPIRIMFTPSAVIIGLVYILLPFMVMPLYSSIENWISRCLRRRAISVPASCRPLSASLSHQRCRELLPDVCW